MNYTELIYSIAGFTSRSVSEERQKPFYERYFDMILDAMRNKSKTVSKNIFRGLLPDTDHTEWLREQLLKKSKEVEGENIHLTKSINQALEETERLLKCRELLKQF